MGCVRGSFVLAALILAASSAVAAQDAPESHDNDRIEFDLSFDYDPEELREDIRKKLRWRRLWGPVGIGPYHVFPAHENRPNEGPPRRIWTNGWGTSMWRDPVTGWPLQ